MKLWQETERIVDALLRLAAEGRGAALARVVAIEGSAYRRPGAKLLVAEGEPPLGSVSGGCLEEDVRLIGLEVAQTGVPRLRLYDTKDENRVFGLGLGCGGSVEIFIQPVSPAAARETWAAARVHLQSSTPFALATVLEGPSAGRMLVVDRASTSGTLGNAGLDEAAADLARGALRVRVPAVQSIEGARLCTEVLLPPPRLLICGAGDDAIPLAAFAAEVGFHVLVADHRPAPLTAERFPGARELFLRRPEDGLPEAFAGPGTFAVVKCHSAGLDGDWVKALLAADVAYVGVLGPRERTLRIVGETGAASRERIFGPVGLDLGAEGAAQVALAIVAELLAVHSGRTPQHLREKEAAVHA